MLSDPENGNLTVGLSTCSKNAFTEKILTNAQDEVSQIQNPILSANAIWGGPYNAISCPGKPATTKAKASQFLRGGAWKIAQGRQA